MPAAFTSLMFCAISSRMKVANASGVLVAGSSPCFMKATFISGVFTIFTMAALRRVTMSRGTFAGASTPYQPERS